MKEKGHCQPAKKITSNTASVPVQRRTLPLVICTVYICLPALLGLLSIAGLTFGDSGPEYRGLVAGGIIGGAIGFPLASLQYFALCHRSMAAAQLQAIILLCIAFMLAIGAVFGLAPDDDNLEAGGWLFSICLLGLTTYTSSVMWRYSKSLRNN